VDAAVAEEEAAAAEAEADGVVDDVRPPVPADPKRTLSDAERMLIFFEVVQAQDDGHSVIASRDLVAKKYGLPSARVASVEEEGIAKNWAPL
jgi:hypothetical protein